MPSCSIGFWVASTKNGCDSLWVTPAAVTDFSCMASNKAAWVFGGVRLISSAKIMFEKTGPGINLKLLSSPNISEPIMSEGIKSGVNCMRLKLRSSTCDTVCTNKVFARPGTPTSRQWPLLKIDISTNFTTSSCPTITLLISVRIC